MKTTLLLLLSCSGVLSIGGLPESLSPFGPARLEGASMRPGVVIETDVQSSRTCRLVVMSDCRTVVDRGLATRLPGRRTFQGSFRYWSEPAGRMLYVYDRAQNLIARVVNPTSVTVVDVLDPID